MINKNLFRYHYSEAGYTLESLSAKMHLNPSTLSRKIKGDSEFTRIEIMNIKNILNLSVNDVEAIFFS